MSLFLLASFSFLNLRVIMWTVQHDKTEEGSKFNSRNAVCKEESGYEVRLTARLNTYIQSFKYRAMCGSTQWVKRQFENTFAMEHFESRCINGYKYYRVLLR